MDVLSEPQDVKVGKGTKLLVRRMNAKLVSLSGMQMKAGVNIEEFEGIITHIYGDHPTEPTKFVFMVKKEDGSEVEVDPEHVIAVIKEVS